MQEPATQTPGRRMAYWIAVTLRQEREKAGISRSHIAASLGLSPKTIDRLEAGESMGRDIDHAIAGYGYILGMNDNRELWQKALDNWSAHGSAPVFKPGGPAEAFARAIRETALRMKQAHGDYTEMRNATPRIRGAC